MIRYLELRNWRAFNKVALHLSEGTTFVVAENGIGKTSLLRGAAWTLFAPRHVDPKVELRHGDGANEAVGVVVMSTADGDLEIERTYRVGGRPANRVDASLAGRRIDPDQLDVVLARVLAVRPEIACELGFVHQHALATDKDLFSNVGQLLRRLTGVEQLQAVRAAMVKAERRHDGAARDLARTAARETSALKELAGEIAAAQSNVQEAEVEERSVREHLDRVNDDVAALQLWGNYDEQHRIYEATRLSLDAELESELASESLVDALDRVATEQSVAAERHAEHMATRHLHEELAGQLQEADAICPVCRQAIDGQQAALADEYHRQAIVSAGREIEIVSGALDEVRDRLGRLRALNRRRSDLASPSPPAIDRPEGENGYEGAVEEARERHVAVQQRLAEARASVAVLQGQLEEAERARETDTRIIQSRRLEATAAATIDVLDRAIGHHVSERINPLSNAIGQSWGQFFTTDGAIQLNDQGEIELERNDGTRLGYGQLSGGQQMLATLTMRLTLVAATTGLECVWLDEPLEHLDPTNRRRAANLLVHAARQQGIRQVLATTYEEETARRLAATDPAVELRYVRSD